MREHGEYLTKSFEKLSLLKDIEDSQDEEDILDYYDDVMDDFRVSVKKGNALMIDFNANSVDGTIPKGCDRKELSRYLFSLQSSMKEWRDIMSFYVYVSQRLEQ